MAHRPQQTLDIEAEYRLLQQRLDRNVTGAPDTPAMRRVLRLLFTPADARVVRQMPILAAVPDLAERLEIPLADLDEHITDLARRGLVLDVERDGIRYAMPAPVVIGFFEFTFMRMRPEAPMEEIADAFEDLFEDEEAVRSIFRGSTQVGRSLVREESLPADSAIEILDWERATSIVRGAARAAVSLCPCRNHARYLGRACDAPLRTCLSFDGAAEMLVRAGVAEEISTDEAMEILAGAKAAGLAQTGDNVKADPGYICNCCGCCCGMMTSIKRFGIADGIVASNWIATIDLTICRGCGTCVKACPAGAIVLEHSNGKGLRRNWAILDADRCLGCGVCFDVCRWEAHGMDPREDRPFVPADTLERVAAMAIERGKIGDFLLDNTGSRLAHAAATVLRAVEKSPPWRALMAADSVRSTFLRGFAAAAARARATDS
jgi:ferredoxin